MTEVDYGGGGHRTRLKDQLINLCVLGCPLPQYIKEQGGGRPALGCAKERGGVLLLVGVGLPFPSPTRKREGGRKERERERERGATPPSPSPIRTPHGRGRATSWLLLSLSPLGSVRPNTSPGGSGNPPALRFSPKSPGTLPVSEYSRPIYQSLCLDHFETPVMSVITSGTPNKLRYIKTYKLIIKLSS